MPGGPCAETAIFKACCPMLDLCDFTREYLPEAGRIALKLWGGEVPDMPPELRAVIYEYLPRYYFDEKSSCNLAVLKNGCLQALLLASSAPPEPLEANAWLQQNLPPGCADYARSYREYLDGNRRLEDRFRSKGDVVLLFFASIRPGCGKLLMEEFIRRARNEQRSNMLLWTDNTCNYQYYFEHDFQLLQQQKADPGLPGLALETLIFRRSF